MARPLEHRPATDFDVVFVGGGLASGLACLALLARQPQLRVAVVERDLLLGGNHTWCFHAADVPRAARPFIEPLVVSRWEGYSVQFPTRVRRVGSPYASITSQRLHEVVSARVHHAPGSTLLLGQHVTRLSADGVLLEEGRWLSAPLVVDARGPTLHDDTRTDDEPSVRPRSEGHPSQARKAPFPTRGRGYQKFVGLELRVRAHSLREPVLFDARLPQHDGFRFMYTLPLSPERLLIEETFFSDGPELDEPTSNLAILAYARAQGYAVAEVLRSERGVLPMPWQDVDFDPTQRPLVAGYRAGLFHPVTGYSLPAAVRFALALSACDFHQLSERPGAQSALTDFARAHAAQRPFLRLLTRLLFTSFAPDQRYSVLSHFYRLPEPLIERFYAGELRAVDRARVFVGAPPRGFSVARTLRLSALGTFPAARTKAGALP